MSLLKLLRPYDFKVGTVVKFSFINLNAGFGSPRWTPKFTTGHGHDILLLNILHVTRVCSVFPVSALQFWMLTGDPNVRVITLEWNLNLTQRQVLTFQSHDGGTCC